ncbi:SMI1/KNR4 family protein [Pedobacter metabolipauper]|uniref:SMI1/KNR4 family protein n=1 Tax=Pedobacter metabolipauper TaxID=425513 RepID=A0A4V3D0K8_9SPHI|nr:SMI1/KNR4 family protein [Pedobacter metabolipauper]TDQ06235.1 hypothetical protein ATK78_4616 [Pedobacter metabolipauper]
MLTVRPIDDIVKAHLSDRHAVRNFPKSLHFSFDKSYIDIVTQIRTTEISSECVLFDSVQSVNETKEFSDPDYWIENYAKGEIDQFWIFGQNGQGDLWLLDFDHKIYFYDHNKEQMCKDNFVELDLNFEKWLQFSDLNKQLDYIYNTENEISEHYKAEFREKLNEISSTLLAKYPFDI